jgi:hypothetical protein
MLSRQLIQKVSEMTPKGRFLKRSASGNCWEDVSNDEEKCREKCAQVLRDAVAYLGLKEPPDASPSPSEHRIMSNPIPHQNQLEPNQDQYTRRSGFMDMGRSESRFVPFPPNSNPYTSARVRYPPVPRYERMPVYEPMTHNQPFPPVPPLQSSRASRPAQQFPLMPPLQSSLDSTRPAHKRRRLSKSNFFERYASLPNESHEQRRFSISNSQPFGSDQPSGPGPRIAAVRKDSLLGSLSLPDGSGHSVASIKDFELFPDLSEINDCMPNEDNDEFSSDFY